MIKKILILTGGGDCPGLNAVIRGIVKRAQREKDWEVYGSIEAFNGVLNDPQEIIKLTNKKIAGIHVRGGTILKTTNKSNPIKFPVSQPDGSLIFSDRSEELAVKLKKLHFAVFPKDRRYWKNQRGVVGHRDRHHLVDHCRRHLAWQHVATNRAPE